MTVRKTLLVLVLTLVAIPLIVGSIRASQAVESQAAQQATQAPQATREAFLAPTAVPGISALGSVEADMVVPLYFQTSGTVQGVYVHLGDYVQAGDVLADIDNSDALNSYNQATLSLENAQISLNTLKQPPSADDLRTARANLASAQAAYSSTANAVSPGKIQADQMKYQQAQDQVTALQQARANMGGTPDQISLQEAKIGAAQFNAQIAQLQLQTDQTPNSTSLWQASLRINQAQLNLDKLQAGPTQAQLDSAQLAIDRAQATVQNAQIALQRTQLIAPHAGYITALNISAGQTVGQGTASAVMTISDISQLRITVPVNELDLNRVKEGASAVIQLDALPGVNIPGKVDKIGWLSTTSSDGIVTYGVQIVLNTNDPRVRIGMTGEVSIETGSGA